MAATISQEHELKVLDIDLKELRAIIKKLGARQILKAKVITVFYDDAKNSFYRRGETLRLRQIGRDVEITYKKRLPGTKIKSRQEIMMQALSFAEAQNFLKRLGLRPISYQEKKRESYRLKDCRLDFDFYPEIPPFLEIEGPSAKEIFQMIRKLKLEKHRTSTLGTLSFMQKHFPKVKWKDLRF